MLKSLFSKEKRFVFIAGLFNHYPNMSDEKYLKKLWKALKGYELNLDMPITFSEKLQWLKLYDRRPEYTMMVDKYAVKKYIADKIGKEYIIPTLGVWDRFEDIDFDSLPNQFVLKCTHDSGGLIICRDKSTLDIDAARKKISESLKRNFFFNTREWPYKNVPPRIIAEKYMEDLSGIDLQDYKFFCFYGVPVYCQVICGRSTNETIDFFDMEWKHQEFTGLSEPHKPFSSVPIPAPVNFEKMKEYASLLSKNSPFLRVDFYEIKSKLYFGELTFYPAAGFGSFYPDKYNKKIGDLIKLPKNVELYEEK